MSKNGKSRKTTEKKAVRKPRAPEACAACYTLTYDWFNKYGNDKWMRPAEKKQILHDFSVLTHKQRQCWLKK